MELIAALLDALRLPPHPAIALAGAGGKTSAMFAMARALAPAVATITTHLAQGQSSLADCHIVWTPGTSCAELALLEHDGVVLLTGELDPATARLSGLSTQQWAALRQWCAGHDRALLVEADGSRQRPLKAPAPHEPAIPDGVDAVVVVAGMLGCGLPLDDEHVHRAARFAAISGCAIGDPVTTGAMAAALSHPEGGLKNIPAGARRAALLSQADTPDLRAAAARIAARLRPPYDVVAVASFRGGAVEIF